MKTSRQLSQIFSDSSSLSPKVLFSSIIADITQNVDKMKGTPEKD